MRSLLLLFLGIPIPIIILIALFSHWAALHNEESIIMATASRKTGQLARLAEAVAW